MLECERSHFNCLRRRSLGACKWIGLNLFFAAPLLVCMRRSPLLCCKSSRTRVSNYVDHLFVAAKDTRHDPDLLVLEGTFCYSRCRTLKVMADLSAKCIRRSLKGRIAFDDIFSCSDRVDAE